MKRDNKLLVPVRFFFLTALVGFGANLIPVQPASAACDQDKLFGFIPSWHEYLECENGGVPKVDDLFDLLAIIAAIIDMVLRVIVVAAIVFFMFGSIQLMLSSGAPEKIAKATSMMTNSIIGLVLGLVTSSVVPTLVEMFGPIGSVGSSGISRVLQIIVQVGAGVAVFMIIKAGIKLTASSGDAGKVASVRGTVEYTVIGLMLLVSAYAIISLVVTSL